jgi:hypothetical protein
MQLRFETALAGEAYVAEQAWRTADLPRCPLHPRGGCAFARHGTYARKTPTGVRIPRWYCPQGHRTFSLLPDFLASHLSGSLHAVEIVVSHAEQCASMETAANALRIDDITLPSAIRWVRRRVRLVHDALLRVHRWFPQYFGDGEASVTALRDRLPGRSALVHLREAVAPYLRALPSPVGFALHSACSNHDRSPLQHKKGPDPPIMLR